MKLSKFLLFSLTLLLALPAAPQQARSNTAASASTAVPPLIPYSGIVSTVPGAQPAASASITFLIYKDEQGGEPLFAETQTVALDATGHYKAQLGATLTNGIPIDLFVTGEARWLEVQIAGEAPQPRVLLVSVPYALKAADAATLGGLPPSAFALARPPSEAVKRGTPRDRAQRHLKRDHHRRHLRDLCPSLQEPLPSSTRPIFVNTDWPGSVWRPRARRLTSQARR